MTQPDLPTRGETLKTSGRSPTSEAWVSREALMFGGAGHLVQADEDVAADPEGWVTPRLGLFGVRLVPARSGEASRPYS